MDDMSITINGIQYFCDHNVAAVFKHLLEENKSARDKIAKLEKVAKAASEVLASDGFHYLGELRDALKELGEK